MFPIETYRKKETAVLLKCIDQLPQNLARVHYLVAFLIDVIKTSNLSIVPIVSTVFYCLSIVRLLFQH